MRRLAFGLAAALLVALVWFLWPRHDPDDAGPAAPPAPAAFRPAGSDSRLAAPTAPAPPPEPRSTLADSLNAPASDIRADLRLVLEVVAAFRSNFPGVGNPVGNNAEITAALTGQNKLRLALVPPDHPAISAAGELCDRWGTPFFFHAESATRMEIRSAGPDRKLWTDDDIVATP